MAVLTSKRQHTQPKLSKRRVKSRALLRRTNGREPVPRRLAANRRRYPPSKVAQLGRGQTLPLNTHHREQAFLPSAIAGLQGATKKWQTRQPRCGRSLLDRRRETTRRENAPIHDQISRGA